MFGICFVCFAYVFVLDLVMLTCCSNDYELVLIVLLLQC